MSERHVQFVFVALFWAYLLYGLVSGSVAVKSYIRRDRRLRRDREPLGYWAYIAVTGTVLSIWTTALISEL